MFLPFLILLLLVIFFEGTVTTLPLVVVLLLLLMINRRDGVVFILAFVSGLLLDLLRLQPLGETSLFLLCFLFLVLLYQRKYEIDSLPFVMIAAFIGTVGFGLVWSDQEIVVEAIVNALLVAFLFVFTKRVHFGRAKNVDFRSV
jgi:cell shape-determining protein MreD